MFLFSVCMYDNILTKHNMSIQIVKKLVAGMAVAGAAFGAMAVSGLALAYSGNPGGGMPVIDVDAKWDIKLDVSASSQDGGISLKWEDLAGKVVFDHYQVIYKKGYHKYFSGSSVHNAYITWNYYNLVDLTPGEWWSFQVVAVRVKNGTYVPVTSRSNVVQIKVEGKKETPVAPKPKSLGIPTIIEPSANEVLTDYPREAYLSWTKVKNAKKYEIELACDVCNSLNEKWSNPAAYTTKKSYFVTPALPGDNEYRFRVRALDKNGVTGPWSEYNYFSFDTSDFEDEDFDSVDLSITAWENGLPRISWSEYKGEFDGYAMFVKEGKVAETDLIVTSPAYFSKNKNSHQMVKMKENTAYTIKMVPYTDAGFDKEFNFEDGSNLLYFTTATSDVFIY